MFQRTSQFVDIGSGATLFSRIVFPIAPGMVVRLRHVRYSLDNVRVSVPTIVQALVFMTPFRAVARLSFATIQRYLEHPMCWLPWVPTFNIGSTSDSSWVEMHKEIPLVGLDLVSDLYLVCFNLNWSLNLQANVELVYEYVSVPDDIRRQLRAMGREQGAEEV